MADKRTARIQLSVSQKVKTFIEQHGGARKTGEGKYNISELFNEFMEGVILGHGPEALFLEKAKEIESLKGELAEREADFKTRSGTSHKAWLAEFYASQSESETRQQKLDELMLAHLEKVFYEANEWLESPGIRDWATIQDWVNHLNPYKEKDNWARVQATGYAGGSAQFIKDFLKWKQDQAPQIVGVLNDV